MRLLLLILLCSSLSASANHIWGGSVTYKHLASNDYLVTAIVYYDCAGAPPPSTVEMEFNSASCDTNWTMTFNVNYQDTMPLWTPFSMDSTVCEGGSFTSVYKLTFIELVTLPFTCNDWEMYLQDDGSIGFSQYYDQSLVGTIGSPMFIAATLDNSVAHNSAPQIIEDIHVQICEGQPYQYDASFSNPDGDSIVYELAPCLTQPAPGTPMAYQVPYNYHQPGAFVDSITLDPVTGLLEMEPSMILFAPVVVMAKDYRNDTLMGTSTHLFPAVAVAHPMCDQVGIYESAELVINAYPNPFADQIVLEGLPPVSKISVYTAEGRLVQQAMSTTVKEDLDVEGPAGLYFIRVDHASGTWSGVLSKTSSN